MKKITIEKNKNESEGIVIRKIYGTERNFNFIPIIAENYFSTIFGILLLSLITNNFEISILNIKYILNRSKISTIKDFESITEKSYICLKNNEKLKENSLVVYLYKNKEDWDKNFEEILSFNNKIELSIFFNDFEDKEIKYSNHTHFSYGEVMKLDNFSNDDWEFKTGNWPIEGIWGENKLTNEKKSFSVELPLAF